MTGDFLTADLARIRLSRNSLMAMINASYVTITAYELLVKNVELAIRPDSLKVSILIGKGHELWPYVQFQSVKNLISRLGYQLSEVKDSMGIVNGYRLSW